MPSAGTRPRKIRNIPQMSGRANASLPGSINVLADDPEAWVTR
jgi:hypothetical protein